MPKRSKLPLCKLGPDFVQWVHDCVIAAIWPDIDPVSQDEYRNINLLDSALARPFHSAGGQDAYPSVTDKSAALFHSMISNHPFQNGNKRTAVLVVDAFLLGNGYMLAIDNDTMYELAQNVASYRQRAISHDQSFQEILDTVMKFSVSLMTFYREQRKDKNLSGLYKKMLSIRRSVRRHPGNILIPV